MVISRFSFPVARPMICEFTRLDHSIARKGLLELALANLSLSKACGHGFKWPSLEGPASVCIGGASRRGLERKHGPSPSSERRWSGRRESSRARQHQGSTGRLTLSEFFQSGSLSAEHGAQDRVEG